MVEPKRAEYEIFYRVDCPEYGEEVYEGEDCPLGKCMSCKFCDQIIDVI